MKTEMRAGSFNHHKMYDKDLFEKELLAGGWDGGLLVCNIPDIALFSNAIDIFPEYVEPSVKKQCGTIHKAKGKEADTVIVGMAVAYPVLRYIKEIEVQDDLMRLFHVATSRPKKKLLEICGYLRYPSGDIAPAPMDVLPRSKSDLFLGEG